LVRDYRLHQCDVAHLVVSWTIPPEPIGPPRPPQKRYSATSLLVGRGGPMGIKVRRSGSDAGRASHGPPQTYVLGEIFRLPIEGPPYAGLRLVEGLCLPTAWAIRRGSSLNDKVGRRGKQVRPTIIYSGRDRCFPTPQNGLGGRCDIRRLEFRRSCHR